MWGRTFQFIFLLALSMVFAVYGNSNDTTEKSKPIRIIVLSDLHGALESQVLFTPQHEGVEIGGAALLSNYIQILRDADSIPTVIVDAGDLFQGTLVSNTNEGRPVIDFYNYLEVDAVAIGNHDFDYGPVGPMAVPRNASDDPVGALKQRIGQAHFPFLAANIVQDDGSRPKWVKTSTIVEKGNIKVGIIGFSSVETPQTTNKKNLVGLTFQDPVNPIIEESRKLRGSGVDYVILVGHSGGGCKDNAPTQWTNLSTCEEGELFRILKQLPLGTIDAAVGGHTHKGIAKKYAGVPVLQPFSNAQDLGWVTLFTQGTHSESDIGRLATICGSGVILDDQVNCNPSVIKTTSLPVKNATFLGKPVYSDSLVESLLKSYFDGVQEIKNRPLGVTSIGEFDRAYFEENALGNFLSDVFHSYFKDVDVVLLNNGGLRANLKAKDLTYGDLFSILPFDNLLAVLQVKGELLIKMMEIGISRKDGGLSWSGVTFHADRCKVLSAEINGEALDVNRTYRILTTDFVAQGGVHFDSLQMNLDQIQILDTLPNMRDEMVDALRHYGHPINPIDYFNPVRPRQNIKNICSDSR